MIRTAVVVIVIAALTGCGSAAPKPSPIEGQLIAGAGVNPDAAGRASPVQVRLYQLKADSQFAAADFMALYRTDESALGEDLLAKDEFTLRPGDETPYAGEIDHETRFIGAFAGFRDYGRASATLRVGIPFDQGNWKVALEAGGGTTWGDAPPQRTWFLGGPRSLRGYDASVAGGTSFGRARNCWITA